MISGDLLASLLRVSNDDLCGLGYVVHYFMLKTETKDTVVIKNKYICIQFVVSCILTARCLCRYRGTGVRTIS